MAQVATKLIRPVVVTSRGETRTLVDTTSCKLHLAAAVTWIGVGIIAGLLYSFVFLRLYPHEGVEILSPGRVRMVHTNLMAYGFLTNAFIGMLHWVVPRLTGEPVLSQALSKIIFVVWNAIVAAAVWGLLNGQAQAIEWGETPFWIDHFVVVGDH